MVKGNTENSTRRWLNLRNLEPDFNFHFLTSREKLRKLFFSVFLIFSSLKENKYSQDCSGTLSIKEVNIIKVLIIVLGL